MKHNALFSGAVADVRACMGNRGNTPAMDFLESLPDFEQVRMMRLIEEFASRGEIRNTARFRAEGRGIYALKSGQIRILCFFLSGATRKTLVLTHGYRKTTQKMPRDEFLRAFRVYKEMTMGR